MNPFITIPVTDDGGKPLDQAAFIRVDQITMVMPGRDGLTIVHTADASYCCTGLTTAEVYGLIGPALADKIVVADQATERSTTPEYLGTMCPGVNSGVRSYLEARGECGVCSEIVPADIDGLARFHHAKEETP